MVETQSRTIIVLARERKPEQSRFGRMIQFNDNGSVCLEGFSVLVLFIDIHVVEKSIAMEMKNHNVATRAGNSFSDTASRRNCNASEDIASLLHSRNGESIPTCWSEYSEETHIGSAEI